MSHHNYVKRVIKKISWYTNNTKTKDRSQQKLVNYYCYHSLKEQKETLSYNSVIFYNIILFYNFPGTFSCFYENKKNETKARKIGPTVSFIIFSDFCMFYQISFHHKGNDVRLLLINMVSSSCLTSCQTTSDLES